MSESESDSGATQERTDFASFMAAMRESDPIWQERVVTAFTSSVSTRDWALLTDEGRTQN
ncbi:hypothetical protein AT728_06220 [Streptomyces silvensis]|uniref:Uncharacterized protein n=1 Tax=Streptomyces silvensis TaxID=1765722 RepID=A0A0W7X7C3_9ACTN|nr:hypothetical protein AT728_06220 [Streptomyces silvensis]